MKTMLLVERRSRDRLLCDERDGQYFFSIEDSPESQSYYRPEQPGMLQDSKAVKRFMVLIFLSAAIWFGAGCIAAWHYGRFPWQQ